MKNKELLEKKIKNLDGSYILGCYDKNIDKLSREELMKIINVIGEEATDVDVMIGNNEYIIELTTVENEKDLSILIKKEYIDRYGNERYEED